MLVCKYWIVVCVLVIASCATTQQKAGSGYSDSDAALHNVYVSEPTNQQIDGLSEIYLGTPLEAVQGVQPLSSETSSSYLLLLLHELNLRRQPTSIDFADCEAITREDRNADMALYCLQQARQLYDLESERKFAKLLVELRPYDPQSYNQLAESHIRSYEYTQALDVLIHSDELGFAPDLAVPAVRAVFLYGDDILGLIDHYRDYIAKKPEKQRLYQGEATLLIRRMEQSYFIGKYQRVLDTIDQILALTEQKKYGAAGQYLDLDLEKVYITRAWCLYQLGRIEEAIASLEEQVKVQQPDFDFAQLDLIKLQLYLKAEQYQKAQKLSIGMVERNKEDDELLLKIGLLAANTPLKEAPQLIRRHFLDISETQPDVQQKEVALYRLSQLAAAVGNTAARVTFLAGIRETDHLVILSVREQARIIGKQDGKEAAEAFYIGQQARFPALAGQMQLARAYWLSSINGDEALDYVTALLNARDGYDQELLYVRGFFYALAGNIPAMENDFSKILAVNPSHVDTLNAYGYTLVDTTDRIQEGLEFVTRAFTLESQRPAIVDSLAWAYFRSGRDRRALVLIQRAYAGSQDPEIAAHYGEILWTLGYTEEAQALLERDRKAHPESQVLQDTWSRLFGR